MERVEQQKNTLREQQLSADRRRRALSDRVNDLEAQVARLESGVSSSRLENRSLLNKVKLADVQPGIIDELKAEIERLKGAPGRQCRRTRTPRRRVCAGSHSGCGARTGPGNGKADV